MRHVDAERTIVFGAEALEAIGEFAADGFTLLTTARAAWSAPAVADRAGTVVEVPDGLVEDVAGDLRGRVDGSLLVALGGGRVIDVAKALAAADPPRTVVAIPTTLSAAEMTQGHRHARGVDPGTARVRPRVVLNDPALSASQPVDRLAASSANALGHALAGLLGDRATPISASIAREGSVRLVAGWSGAAPDRERVALGALLAGWALDHSGLGLHHVLAQTAVRTAAIGHAQANAALLPATIAALRRRRPDDLARLDGELGVELEVVARDLRDRAGADLGALAVDDELLERAVEGAASRPEIGRVAPAPDRAELRAIYRAATKG